MTSITQLQYTCKALHMSLECNVHTVIKPDLYIRTVGHSEDGKRKSRIGRLPRCLKRPTWSAQEKEVEE